MLKIFRVTENSMAPEYLEGDFVLVAKIPLVFSMRVGDVIVFRHQRYGVLIKQVQAMTPDGGEISVIGRHPKSVDSRTFGPISSGDVLGKVIWHIRRPGSTERD